MKLKDYVTLGNLLSGLGAVVALIENQFDMACYLIFVAYVFDNLDGPIARLTNQFDSFGAHLDTACDYVTNSIAAPFMIYYAFSHFAQYPIWLSSIIAAFPATLGTIRQAQGSDEDLSYPCYYLGLPRPASALFFIALINSSFWHAGLFESWRWLIYPLSAFCVISVSFLHIRSVPFVSNKSRRWDKWMWFGKYAFLGGAPLLFLISWLVFDYPSIIFDYMLFCLFMFISLSWTQIPQGDYKRITYYLKTKEVLLPLVYKDSEWRPQGFICPALEDTTEWDEEVNERLEALFKD